MQIKAKEVIIIIAVMVLYSMMSVYFVNYGSYGWDEGYYLSACKAVADGKMMYSDFAYTQTPVLPYLYGYLLKGTGIHLFSGRMLTAVLGLFNVMVGLWMIKRQSNYFALLTAGCLFLSSPFLIYNLSVVYTHALTSLFILLSVYFSLPGRGKYALLISIFFMILAVSTRLTVIMAVIPLLLFYVYQQRKDGKSLVLFCLLLLLSGLLYLPFIITSKDTFLFSIYGYHLLWNPSFRAVIITKLFQLAQFEEHNLLIFGTGVMVLLVYLWKRWKVQSGYYLGIGIFLVLLLSQFLLRRFGPSYWINVLPLAIVLMSIGAGRIWQDIICKSKRPWILPVVLVTCSVTAAGIHLSYFTDYRVLDGKRVYDLEYIDSIAAYIKQNTPANSLLFTLDNIIPIEADRTQFPGTEMSIFSYYPEMSDVQCSRYHLLNNQQIRNIIQSEKAASVVYIDQSLNGDYATGLSLGGKHIDDIKRTIMEHYQLSKVFPHSGPLISQKTVYIYLPVRK